MSWWGKILGGIFGYLVDGPVTALLGAAVGHAVDSLGGMFRKRPKIKPRYRRQKQNSAYTAQITFFTSAFSVMGYVCKSDGNITQEEINVATQIMDSLELSKSQRVKAIKLFNEGKKPSFPLLKVLHKFREACQMKKPLIRDFMELQVAVAMADGELSMTERRLLIEISQRIGILRMEYERIEQNMRSRMNVASEDPATGSSEGVSSPNTKLQDAYTMLGIESGVSDGDLKKTYRRLLSQHHPDKLVSKGVNEDKIKQASEKTYQIRQAYETICHSRGI